MMPTAVSSAHSRRKDEHLDLATTRPVEPGDAGWADVRLVHEALPEVDLDAIDLSVDLLGSIEDLIDHTVLKICDQLGVHTDLVGRWTGLPSGG